MTSLTIVFRGISWVILCIICLFMYDFRLNIICVFFVYCHFHHVFSRNMWTANSSFFPNQILSKLLACYHSTLNWSQWMSITIQQCFYTYDLLLNCLELRYIKFICLPQILGLSWYPQTISQDILHLKIFCWFTRILALFC